MTTGNNQEPAADAAEATAAAMERVFGGLSRVGREEVETLYAALGGDPAAAARFAPRTPRPKAGRWAALAAAVCLAAAAWAAAPLHLPERGAPVATGGEIVWLGLADGTRVEAARGTRLRLDQSWLSRTVELESGAVIVHAAHQRWGHRFGVETADCRVSVRGTVFAVEANDAGSRVGVREGRVRVDVAGVHSPRYLAAGEQTVTGADMRREPLGALFAWGDAEATPAATALTPRTAQAAAAPPITGIPAPAIPQTPVQSAAKPPAPAAPAGAALAPAPVSAPAAENAAQQLFRLAKAGLDPIPEQDRPMVMERIVERELAVFPQQALADYKTLFQMALDLPTPTASTPFYSYLKQETELSAVTHMVEEKHIEEALALARTADTPRNYLYNRIISASDPPQRAMALIEECLRGDGTFPYQAAGRVAGNPTIDAADQRQLLEQVYRAVAADTNPIEFGSAGGPEALAAGHRLAPALDADLASALTAVIGLYGRQTDPSRYAIQANRMMALLRDVNADRARELEAQYPAFAVAPARPQIDHELGPGGTYRMVAGPRPDIAAADLAAADPGQAEAYAQGIADALDRFRALAAVANALAAAHASGAAAAAAAAQTALTDDVLASGDALSYAAKLAQSLHQLGDVAASRALLGRALDQADRAAASYEAVYRAAPLDAPAGAPSGMYASKVLMGTNIGATQYPELDAYAAAADLDFGLAVSRAGALPSDTLRPLVYAYVAGEWKR